MSAHIANSVRKRAGDGDDLDRFVGLEQQLQPLTNHGVIVGQQYAKRSPRQLRVFPYGSTGALTHVVNARAPRKPDVSSHPLLRAVNYAGPALIQPNVGAREATQPRHHRASQADLTRTGNRERDPTFPVPG
ncbi:MAG: hypothetical protein NVS1B9_00180 [Solirubrobacteraceae bacterium]